MENTERNGYLIRLKETYILMMYADSKPRQGLNAGRRFSAQIVAECWPSLFFISWSISDKNLRESLYITLHLTAERDSAQ